MSVSRKIKAAMEGASWIRRMFEEGAELKARLGPERVFDFTLGNPDLEPPLRFKEALAEAVRDPSPGLHGYMFNAGFLNTREALAGHLSSMYRRDFGPQDLVLTSGAAGALNIILKALLDPGDEVIIFAPFFPDYPFYADNHGGLVRVVETDPTFQLDLEALQNALSPRTKAVLINSPNNPTGQVYPENSLGKMGELLQEHGNKVGRVVYLVADEPYSRILYDGLVLPNIFEVYPHTLLATSFSKDLSIPGERLGLCSQWLALPLSRALQGLATVGALRWKNLAPLGRPVCQDLANWVDRLRAQRAWLTARVAIPLPAKLVPSLAPCQAPQVVELRRPRLPILELHSAPQAPPLQ